MYAIDYLSTNIYKISQGLSLNPNSDSFKRDRVLGEHEKNQGLTSTKYISTLLLRNSNKFCKYIQIYMFVYNLTKNSNKGKESL